MSLSRAAFQRLNAQFSNLYRSVLWNVVNFDTSATVWIQVKLVYCRNPVDGSTLIVSGY